MENKLKPKFDTDEQKFIFMLFERIELLEESIDKQNKEIDYLKTNQINLSYNIEKNIFNNDCIIEWNIIEHPDTLTIYNIHCGKKFKPNELYWNADIVIKNTIFLSNDKICLKLFGVDIATFTVSKINFRKYVMMIYEFYSRKLTSSEVSYLKNSEYDFKDYDGIMSWGEYFMSIKQCKDIILDDLIYKYSEDLYEKNNTYEYEFIH
jgi:hypothetical protein